jgi:hypothetical protein
VDNSILTSIKRVLGIEPDYIQFDPDIIINVNSALMSLTQLGVGPEAGFMITGAVETWTDFLGDRKDLEAVKTFVYLKVRLLFDPPSNAFLVDAMERQIKELEWRLNVQVENAAYVSPVVEGGTTIG